MTYDMLAHSTIFVSLRRGSINLTSTPVSAAVRMAEQSVGEISSLNVLFVGAGEMNENVATYFAAKQPN